MLRTFYGALAVAVAAILALSLLPTNSGCVAPAMMLIFCLASPVAVAAAIGLILRGVLWRVGLRLLVSYFLIGILPIPFLLGLLYLGAWAVAGQLAGRRLEVGLEQHAAELDSVAAAVAENQNRAPGRRVATGRLWDQAVLRFPALEDGGWSLSGPRASRRGPLADILPAPEFDEPIVTRINDGLFLVAGRDLDDGGRALLYVDLEGALAKRLAEDTGIGFCLDVAVTRQDGVDGRDLDLSPCRPQDPAELEHRSGFAPFSSRIVYWLVPLGRRMIDWETGEAEPGLALSGLLRTSMAQEFGEFFGESGLDEEMDTSVGMIVRVVLLGLFGSFVVLYLIASLIAAILVFRVARATGRLTTAFAEIQKGNFDHRARLRGHDQLTGLVDGFNQMAEGLAEAVEIRSTKEGLERELGVARDLQQRLLPAGDFRFPGVDIAVDFRPAAAIGGDFYHFVREGEDRLVVVIADVSGHGLPTGIVMASAKASLSALAATGADTVRILTTLDQEILKMTDKRTFVTLAHVRFCLSDRRAEVTNAGHIYPYRVDPEGRVTEVENPSRPLGLALPVEFVTKTVSIEPGETWILVSDGIVEAQDPSGELYGFDRLARVASGTHGRSAAAIRDRLLADWRTFTGGDSPADDRTLIVVRIEPAAT